jgi:hypothetical protein
MPISIPKKLNGNLLKLIACFTMLIDHTTAGIMLPMIRDGLYAGGLTNHELNLIYKILRGIGRTAFPIFCFLIVEGFFHTKSRLKYALNLLLFGIISEPFFDLTLYAKADKYDFNIIKVLTANSDILISHQNVYFTLLIGLLVIWGIETIQTRFGRILPLSDPMDMNLATVDGNINFISLILSGALAAGCAYLAQRLHTDYRWWGVTLIVIFYLLRDFGVLSLLGGYLFISNLGTEYLSFPAFILLLFYNKKRGKRLGRLKYCFYFFYPVHLLVIHLIRCLLFGLA